MTSLQYGRIVTLSGMLDLPFSRHRHVLTPSMWCQGKTSKGGPLSPAKATQAASKAAKSGGSNNGVILGGLAAAAVVGLAVAAPKDKAAGEADADTL